MIKRLLFISSLLAVASSNVYAESYVIIGGMIGPHPKDFTERFNAIKGDSPITLRRIHITAQKGTQVQSLGNGVTLKAHKVTAGDAFKSIKISCSGLQHEKKMYACLFGMVTVALSVDTSLHNRDFTNIIQQAVNTGKAIHNQSGVDYIITADTNKKTMSMLVKADTPERREKMDDIDEEYMKSNKCNPSIELCIKSK
ncbi:Uncharacterised protein [Neisseria zoodegmatis]|uniref:Uncharacterized protein n=1 Tax=Neisseria zoodegmatis TaxID=326523 RepID=A0A378WGW4_9NEIS|nr:hypothetical protein [Neisseria zoodegmatis]SUA36322.1 Uncharacterised protein [Neisseria zoodegmatis]